MNSEMSVEAQLVENVLKELDEISIRISLRILLTESLQPVYRTRQTLKRESIRKEFAKALLVSKQTQRLYFIVRSLIMTRALLGAIITLAIFWRLGTINVTEDFVLGTSTYAICLVLSRLFDKRMVHISEKIIVYLGEHTKLRDFIVKNL